MACSSSQDLFEDSFSQQTSEDERCPSMTTTYDETEFEERNVSSVVDGI